MSAILAHGVAPACGQPGCRDRPGASPDLFPGPPAVPDALPAAARRAGRTSCHGVERGARPCSGADPPPGRRLQVPEARWRHSSPRAPGPIPLGTAPTRFMAQTPVHRSPPGWVRGRRPETTARPEDLVAQLAVSQKPDLHRGDHGDRAKSSGPAGKAWQNGTSQARGPAFTTRRIDVVRCTIRRRSRLIRTDQKFLSLARSSL